MYSVFVRRATQLAIHLRSSAHCDRVQFKPQHTSNPFKSSNSEERKEFKEGEKEPESITRNQLKLRGDHENARGRGMCAHLQDPVCALDVHIRIAYIAFCSDQQHHKGV